MSTEILPVGEIILTNERGLIGAGYNYGLTSGPGGTTNFDTGSFGLPKREIRRLRFDHCFIIVPESPVPWMPTDDDLKGFFRFVLTNESGETVTDVAYDFAGDPKYTFKNMVHYTMSHGSPYLVPAENEKTPNGRYELTCSVNPEVVNCSPVRFSLEIEGENIWMYAPPIRLVQFLVPFREGEVSRKDLNPDAPEPVKPA